MLAVDVAPDPKDVSRLIGNLIITGHIVSSIEALYLHVPLHQRGALIQAAVDGTYALLPDDVAERTRRWQDLCDFGITQSGDDRAKKPAREHTAFDGLKLGLGLALVFWAATFFLLYYRSKPVAHSLNRATAPMFSQGNLTGPAILPANSPQAGQ